MNIRIKGISTLFILLNGLISACYFPERTLPGVTMMIVAPRNGAVLEMGPINVGAVAEIEDGSRFFEAGLGTFKFYVNGEQLAEFPASDYHTYGSMSTIWNPTASGEYFLNVEVEIENWEATSAPVRVCIINPVEVEDLFSGGIWGYEGPCEDHPSQYPFIELGGYSLSVIATPPDKLDFDPEGFGPCTPPTITFDATVVDETAFISHVMIEYSVHLGDRGVGFQDRLFLTRTGGSHPEEIYTGTTHSLDGLIQSTIEHVGGPPTQVRWIAYSFASDWLLVNTFGPETISLEPCPLGVSIMPSPTPLSIVVMPTATEDNFRCDTFKKIPIKPVTLAWVGGSPLTFYFKMQGGVPGLENEGTGDSASWSYSVDWGGYNTEQCEFIPGYDERLYCTIEFPADYANSNKPMELYVNGCDTPIYSNPRAEVPAFGGGPVNTEGDSGSEGGGCQPPPGGCGQNSSWFAEPYCMCSPY